MLFISVDHCVSHFGGMDGATSAALCVCDTAALAGGICSRSLFFEPDFSCKSHIGHCRRIADTHDCRATQGIHEKARRLAGAI